MDLTELTLTTIMKWVLLVLAAGFIGQFGKSFATHLLDKARARKSARQTADRTPPSVAPAPRLREDAGQAALPAAGGAAADVPPPDRLRTVPPVPDGSALPDKKTLKTLAKIRKKEMKSPKG